MKNKIIAITTGDIDGIGLEVTSKALTSKDVPSGTYLIYREPRPPKKAWKPLPARKTHSVSSLANALDYIRQKKIKKPFVEILSNESPALWVKEAAEAAKNGLVSGLATGPVSKKTFIESGLDSIGHTPLLKKICNADEVFMGFLGQKFNVILLSGHIPLNTVEKKLDKEYLSKAFQILQVWRNGLPPSFKKKPAGLLGLNPHAGESGLIGNFEKDILIPQIKSFPWIQGPLVPDAAFFSSQWKKYSFYLALYHDQGLIPFKMIHGHKHGVHISIGLPIVRTSVNHGTGFDIFGKSIAQPGSMIDALRWCHVLINKKGF